MLPTFLCIGAQKAGTTWLYEQIRQHPDFWFPPPFKEVHFFDYHYAAGGRQSSRPVLRTFSRMNIFYRLSPYIRRIRNHPDILSEDWYRQVYDHPKARGRVACDFTPAYSMINDKGVEAAKRLLPDAKVLLIIREPVSRAASQIRMDYHRKGYGPKDNESEGAVDDDSSFNWRAAAKSALLRSRYSIIVPRWRSAFGDNFHCIAFRRIVTEPHRVLAEVEKLNGVKSMSYKRAEEQIHQTKAVDIPPEVYAYLNKKLAPERDFILREFGSEFAAQT